jgi:hypothetical protein
VDPIVLEIETQSFLEKVVYAVPLIEALGPIIKTLLFFAAIIIALFVFKKELREILNVIIQRLKSGSGVKAGPFELSELKQQDEKTQRETLAEEVTEVVDSISQIQYDDIDHNKFIKQTRSELTETYSQAESFGLRAMEVDVGVPIKRQVSIRGGAKADGVFVIDGVYHVVEVKFTPSVISRSVLSKLIYDFNKIRSIFRKVVFHIVIVTGADDMKDANHKAISDVMTQYAPGTIIAKVYTMSELRKRFLPGD